MLMAANSFTTDETLLLDRTELRLGRKAPPWSGKTLRTLCLSQSNEAGSRRPTSRNQVQPPAREQTSQNVFQPISLEVLLGFRHFVLFYIVGECLWLHSSQDRKDLPQVQKAMALPLQSVVYNVHYSHWDHLVADSLVQTINRAFIWDLCQTRSRTRTRNVQIADTRSTQIGKSQDNCSYKWQMEVITEK